MLNILLQFKSSDTVFSVNKSIDLDDEYDYDCILLDICNMLHDTGVVEFFMSGFGDDNWGTDCKADLPCVLERMLDILPAIQTKADFQIDFYEQGIERMLNFYHKEGMFIIECKSYVNAVPIPIIKMHYNDVRNIFIKLYKDFISCVKILVPKAMENELFIEWINICNKYLEQMQVI